nr:extracellular solute-binding protein [Paenibacillus ginsengarvi]
MFLNEENYRREYANIVEYKFPELKIEIVPYSELMQPGKQTIKSYIEFMNMHKPDIITILPIPGLFDALIQGGYLLALDPYIAKHRFDLDQYAPLVTKLFRDKGQGNVYGLPPSFSTNALYYNKDLFDKLKIEYPRNGMSFKDVFDLAYRFAQQGNGEPIVGFYMKNTTPRSFLRYVGNMEGLQWTDAAGRSMTIQTSAWEKAFTTVIDAYRSGAMFDASLLETQLQNNEWRKNYEAVIEEARKSSLFANGKAAMTIDSPLLINDIKRLQPDMNWDLVSLPSHGGPIPSEYVNFQTIHAISSGTSLAEESWNAIELLHSDQVEKTNASIYGLLFNRLPVRMKNIVYPQSKNFEAFYTLETEEKGVAEAQTPAGVNKLVEQLFPDLLDNKLSVSDALRIIQEQGNALLLQDREAKDE